jgi:glutathione S-transferase
VRALQIGSRLLAALRHYFVGEALTFTKCAHSGALNRADVHEHVAGAIARGDESKTLLRIEKLDGTCGHNDLPCVRRCFKLRSARAIIASCDRNSKFLR